MAIGSTRGRGPIALSGLLLLIVVSSAAVSAVTYFQRIKAPTTTAIAESTTMAEQNISNQGISDLPSRSEGRLDNANRWYLVMIALGAVFGAGSILSSALIYRFSSQVSVEQKLKIQTLNAHLLDAGLQIAKANQAAEEARLATETLRSQVGWRQITETDANILTAAFSTSPSKVHLSYIAGDPEALLFAFQIHKIFKDANWTVTVQAFLLADRLLPGISVPKEPSAMNAPIRTALESIGWKIEDYSLPEVEVFWGQVADGGEATIFIGLNPNFVMAPIILHPNVKP